MKISRGTYEALNVSSFLALDIETTGLDPITDEIIEIGIVRMEYGKITSRYTQLVNPQRNIPRFITSLTGIRTEDCKDQPTMDELLPEISERIQDTLVVMHNKDFDYGFLKQAWTAHHSESKIFPPTQVLDTLLLSRTLFPYKESHRLATLAEYFNVPLDPNHRAVVDAETTAYIFHGCISHALAVDYETLENVHRILTGVSDGLFLFFDRVLRFVKDYDFVKKKRKSYKGPNNIIGIPTPPTEKSGIQNIVTEAVDAYFGNDGFLSQAIGHFEHRTPQQEMAQFIGRSFNQNEIAVVEAGTGVGKSLAYLIPAVLWILKNPNSRIVLSTQTKTLQDQLFTKEIPLLQSIIQSSFQAVILKGRSNYLCLRRWNEFLNDLDFRLVPNQRLNILPLVSWVFETQTGDIEENVGFHKERNRAIWSEIQSDSADCVGSQCAFDKKCFYQKIRRASKTANLIVVNHSLLFSDLVANRGVLGEYDTLIVDEAHQMEKVASQCFDQVLHIWRFRDFCQSLYEHRGMERGFVVTLERQIQDVPDQASQRDEWDKILKKLKLDVSSLKQSAELLFSLLGNAAAEIFPKGYRKIRLEKGDILFEAKRSELENVRTSLRDILHGLQRIENILIETTSLVSTHPVSEGLAYIIQNAKELEALFEYFVKGEYEDHIVWCEQPTYLENNPLFLHSVPLDIAGILSQYLYPNLERGVLTSATMTVADTFQYIESRLGLNSEDDDKVVSKAFGSPFEYSHQALFLIPTYLATPKEESYVQDICQLLKQILPSYNRGTLILFTSHQMLQDCYENLQPFLIEKGLHVYGQGIDGSRYQLLKMFQTHQKSVLLGTGSFWEGVDIPGAALEMLVITRIPFDAPNDPLIEARLNQVQKDTGNGFLNFSVPEAVIRFRQGFGRLIRSGEDRGVVLILDSRIATHRYGTFFQESIPVNPVICKNFDEITTNLNQWFEIKKNV